MPEHIVAIGLIMFFALLVHGAAGFGSALIAMPLLVPILGVGHAASLFALLIFTSEIVMLIRYRKSLQISDVWRLMVGAGIGIPLGVYAIQRVPEPFVLLLLGLVTAGYGLHALLGRQGLVINEPEWGYGFGFLAGILSGAYNTGGPPYVIYGTGRGWQPSEFKSNLQSVFLISSIMVIVSHFLHRDFTEEVMAQYAFTLPVVLVGMGLGMAVGGRVNPATFRKGVLVLLVALGLRLIVVSTMGIVGI